MEAGASPALAVVEAPVDLLPSGCYYILQISADTDHIAVRSYMNNPIFEYSLAEGAAELPVQLVNGTGYKYIGQIRHNFARPFQNMRVSHVARQTGLFDLMVINTTLGPISSFGANDEYLLSVEFQSNIFWHNEALLRRNSQAHHQDLGVPEIEPSFANGGVILSQLVSEDCWKGSHYQGATLSFGQWSYGNGTER